MTLFLCITHSGLLAISGVNHSLWSSPTAVLIITTDRAVNTWLWQLAGWMGTLFIMHVDIWYMGFFYWQGVTEDMMKISNYIQNTYKMQLLIRATVVVSFNYTTVGEWIVVWVITRHKLMWMLIFTNLIDEIFYRSIVSKNGHRIKQLNRDMVWKGDSSIAEFNL